MKVLVTSLALCAAVIGLSSTTVAAPTAAQCEAVFEADVPAHFVSTVDFNRDPINVDSLKSMNLIVVTPQLVSRFWQADQPLQVNMVVDLKNSTRAQYISTLVRVYGIEVSFGRIDDFTIGFLDMRMKGPASGFERFLKNPLARRTVLWAGLGSPLPFIERITPQFYGHDSRTTAHDKPSEWNVFSNARRSNASASDVANDGTRGERTDPRFIDPIYNNRGHRNSPRRNNPDTVEDHRSPSHDNGYGPYFAE